MRRLAACIGLAVLCRAQLPVHTFFSDVDDSRQPYALYLPKGYDMARKYPLVVSLHADESNHVVNLRQVLGRAQVDFIVACPYGRGSMGFQGIAEKDVYDMMAEVRRRYSIDEDRVYLTGIDVGGGAALRLALTRPDLWAAVAPVCAMAPPGIEELAGNALNLPVRLFHGDEDPLAPVASSRLWQKRFLDVGVRAEYMEYPGVRHNAWDFAYRGGALFQWFARFRRERAPERVRFTTRAYKYNSAYWLRIDGLTPGTPASIDARTVAANRIEVTTSGVDAFTLLRPGPLTVVIDGRTLRHAGATAAFRRTPKGWIDGALPYASGEKQPGLEGPLGEAIASRHIYVYGTADAPPPDELDRRRAIATRAAEWSSPRSRLMLRLAVKADGDVTPQDLENANLVLFGNRRTNTLVARFAADLPLELSTGAADYGLVLIAPAGRHYLVVNSGLPWWTGAGAEMPWRVLAGFGDFVLFKGSVSHIVAAGRFDRRWKTPPDAAAKMQASGTVTLR